MLQVQQRLHCVQLRACYRALLSRTASSLCKPELLTLRKHALCCCATVAQGRYRIEERDLEKVELVSLGFSIFKEIDEVRLML
jgi:hypothetical protein